MSLKIPFSGACERNKDPIIEVISPYLQEAKSVLEIGSGTGQHALYFAEHLPHLVWQTSDQTQYLAGLNAQIDNAQTQLGEAALANIRYPIELDVMQKDWLRDLSPRQSFDVIYSANTLHIMPWAAVQAFFSGLNQNIVNDNALLILYGPFKYAQQYTSASNQAFDQELRSRGVGSGLRDFESIEEQANAVGFKLLKDVAMPANNQCLIWRKGSHL